MNKSIYVSLKKYNSPFYPVNAIFTLNNVKYNLVFETVTQAKNYFINRFFPLNIVFKSDF